MANSWPREDEASMNAFFGQKGQHQVQLVLPYKMHLAWAPSQVVNHITCHEKVRESLERILKNTLEEYGIEDIRRLRLDLFGGCYNKRLMRGSKSKWSIHSWGCAFDMDPAHNTLKMHHNRASLAKADYKRFWEIVETEGWYSLGRKKDYDWMHFQAARR